MHISEAHALASIDARAAFTAEYDKQKAAGLSHEEASLWADDASQDAYDVKMRELGS